jgi:hypothetical protein
MTVVLFGLSWVVAIGGCTKDAPPTEEAPAKAASAASLATGPVEPAAVAAAPEAPTPPTGRSKPPTLNEWAAMTREVTVKGSSALGCETKIVREWLRVSCRGKNDTGGTPTKLRVVRGGNNEAMTFASGGVTSLVVPFVEGTDLAVSFSWTDKSHRLTIRWPRGAPQPPAVGVFEGAASPL